MGGRPVVAPMRFEGWNVGVVEQRYKGEGQDVHFLSSPLSGAASAVLGSSSSVPHCPPSGATSVVLDPPSGATSVVLSPPLPTTITEDDEGIKVNDVKEATESSSRVRQPVISLMLEGQRLVPSGKIPDSELYDVFSVFDLLIGEEVYRSSDSWNSDLVDIQQLVGRYPSDAKPHVMVTYSFK